MMILHFLEERQEDCFFATKAERHEETRRKNWKGVTITIKKIPLNFCAGLYDLLLIFSVA